MNGGMKRLYKCRVTGKYLLQGASGAWFVLVTKRMRDRGHHWKEYPSDSIVTKHLVLIGVKVKLNYRRK